MTVSVGVLDQLAVDIRDAVRTPRPPPGIMAPAALMVALGAGAKTDGAAVTLVAAMLPATTPPAAAVPARQATRSKPVDGASIAVADVRS